MKDHAGIQIVREDDYFLNMFLKFQSRTTYLIIVSVQNSIVKRNWVFCEIIETKPYDFGK